MTDTEIVEKLVLFMGWKFHNTGDQYVRDDHCVFRVDTGKDKYKFWNPLENISDAWEIEEKVLEKQLRLSYVTKLSEILDVDSISWFYSFNLIHAKPRQRCMAVLKVIDEN